MAGGTHTRTNLKESAVNSVVHRLDGSGDVMSSFSGVGYGGLPVAHVLVTFGCRLAAVDRSARGELGEECGLGL